MVWPLTFFGAATIALFGYAFWLFWWDTREPVLASIYAACLVVVCVAFVSSFLIR
jgi:hypothetical protein